MAFMGYETPVAMPSMGVYNTDLMKMYIAGVKDQYEKSQEELKDFMKLYGDFYSDIPGATERYNQMTVAGARDMINQMLANGIDPYKSPEARAAISRYIASRDTATLNRYKRDAENAKEYKKNRDKLIMAGQFDPEFEKWRLGGKTLETWDPNTPFTETTPYAKQDWATVAAPYLKEFEKTEILKSDIPGYDKKGVSDENQRKGVDAVMNAISSNPWLQYKLESAYDSTAGMKDETGAPLSEEQRRALATQAVRKEAENAAAQYYQPKYEVNPFYMEDYKTKNAIKKYWNTTGSNPRNNGNGDNNTASEHPSYGHTMYYQGVGMLFGLNPIEASQYITSSKNEIGKAIAGREDQLMKNRRQTGKNHPYDFKGVIADHTSNGDAKSNIELLGLSGAKPRSAAVQISKQNSSSSTPKLVTVGTLRNDQIQLDSDIKSRMVSDYILVQSNAGYASKRHSGERYGFATNKKNAKYATITDKVVTQLSKNGRVEQYVKVILHDDHNKPIDVAYMLAQRSMQTPGGQSMAMRKLYGSEQNMQLDVITDYGGRYVKDAAATQRYANKSKKDNDVYESGSYSDEEYDDEE